jgi:hemerythrin-like domain-containing protein
MTSEQRRGPQPLGELRPLLTQDHARLDLLLEQLTAAEACVDLASLWMEFESGLKRHMQLEESNLFPGLQQLAPAEAAVLVREHAEIRSQLSRLHVAVELRLATGELAEEFGRLLRSHASREDALIYRWAEKHVAGATRRLLMAYLRGVLHKVSDRASAELSL